MPASVLVGLAWASWHYPVKFDAFLDDGPWGALASLDALTIKISAISELNLAAPFVVLALVLAAYAKRQGWGDLRAPPDCSGR